jgi:anti-sigma factor RsiW
MSMDRHEPFEELISASLQGDLTADERRRLDAHLDGCATCRATLGSFADQRRIMAGLRHVVPPRDLAARVRAGVEAGTHRATPWWRRPPAIFAGVGGGLALATGALLAVVLLGDPTDDPEVGLPTTTPTATAVASATAVPALPPAATPTPILPPVSSVPAPSVAPAPTATPVEASPEPDAFLAVTGPADNQAMTVREGSTGETLQEVETPPGVPIAAELSPDGQWLAYIVDVGTVSGLTEVRATRVAEGVPSDDPEALPPIDSPVEVGETLPLGESVGGSPFVEHLFWSSDGRYLAYTLVDRDGDGTDVWIFRPEEASVSPITEVGNAYAGSWVPGTAGSSLLWISTAGETPESHLWMIHDDAAEITPGDPADSEFPSATNVFQPILSPNGALVIYWTGRMARDGDEWIFVEGGSPWLAENRRSGERGFEFENAREVFRDVTVRQNAFSSAAVRWGLDGDAFAVWDAAWTGEDQGTGDEYPDRSRVYLTRASDPRGLTQLHAIDKADLPDGWSVVDVKVAGSGRHLAITVRRPLEGDRSVPEAELVLITRNTGNQADERRVLGSGEEQWFGPAVFSQAEWASLIGE